MKIVYMGTPDFAACILKGLIEAKGHEVAAVVTQPDKARGRSGKLIHTPVKELALEHGIPVYTPARIRDVEKINEITTLDCDIAVVAAFGQILPKEILEWPSYGCINVHASLLPRWRGAAPIQWSIMAGDEKSGITIMKMDEGLDTGDMISWESCDILPDTTGEMLHDQLAEIGQELLLKTLSDIEKSGEISAVPQKQQESTYARMLTKDMGKIDLGREAVEIERYVRALNPWPGTAVSFRGKTLKLWKTDVVPQDTKELPGTVVQVTKEDFTVQTGKGCLKVREVQLEGKKRMDAGSFLRGNPMECGEVIGSGSASVPISVEKR